MANNRIIIIKKAIKENNKDYSYWINYEDNTIRRKKREEYNPEGDIILKIDYKKGKKDRFVLNNKGDVVLEKQTKEEKEKAKQEYKGNPWNSKVWKEERKKLLEGYKNCEWCWAEKTLTIHHMKDYYEWGDPAYSKLEDKENIVRICSRCHFIYHNYNHKVCKKCHKKYHHLRWDECVNCFKKTSKNKELIKKRVKEEKLIQIQKDKKYNEEKKFILSIKKGDSYINYSKIPESLIPKWKKLYKKSTTISEEDANYKF